MQQPLDSILLVDDENLFHLVFEDACSLLDISLNLETISSADKADQVFKDISTGSRKKKPDCVFVDLNILGSSFDGIELVNRINNTYGNGVIIGIISSSSDTIEIDKAKAAGAQFWIVKTDFIEPRLEAFKEDMAGYKARTAPFKVYA